MARRHQPAAADTLDELESAAERLGEWLQAHLRVVLAVIAGLLVLAGLLSWIVSAHGRTEQAASTALAKVRADYLSAMGAQPGSVQVPKLANPEAAAQIASEYRERFNEVAQSYPDTVAGTLASLESARLANKAGDLDGALSIAEKALANAPSRPAVRGLVLQQIAQWLEAEGRWKEASQRHEESADIDDYPLRAWALADAARCADKAGETQRALALYDRLRTEAPDLRLPDYQQARVAELRARAATPEAESPAP